MNLLPDLIIKIIPLILLIVLGYSAGKFFKVEKRTISSLLIYIITPVIILNGIINTELSLAKLSLPLLFFTLATIISIATYHVAGKIWKDSTRNILAYTSGTGNAGYFGLLVAIALFGEDIVGLVVLSLLGLVLYGNTVGYYLAARGNFTVKKSLKKLITLPAVYAFIIGVVINLLDINLGEGFVVFSNNFSGAYTVLGMMLVGLGISDIKSFKIDLKFISFAFVVKFIVWPLLITAVILIDKNYIGLWSNNEYNIMLLMSLVPLAANTVTYATEFKADSGKAAIAVVLSTLWGIFYIPIIVSLFL